MILFVGLITGIIWNSISTNSNVRIKPLAAHSVPGTRKAQFRMEAQVEDRPRRHWVHAAFEKSDLHLHAITAALDVVGVGLHHCYLRAKRLDGSLSISQLLGSVEHLCVLKV